MLNSIDYFYYDHDNMVLLIGSNGHFFASRSKALELLEILCEANGRSVAGSVSLFRKVNQAHQKAGVLVNPASCEIYFPTHASSNSDCIWINYGKIQKVFTKPGNTCCIVFAGGKELDVTCSRKVIRNQMKRCEHLLKSLCNPYEMLNDSVVLM